MIAQFYNDDSRRRSALVGHSAAENVCPRRGRESYPQFLPWCDRAVVSVNEPGRTVATLHINFRGLKKEFTTENFNRADARIDMKLVSGPFRRLEGSWCSPRFRRMHAKWN